MSHRLPFIAVLVLGCLACRLVEDVAPPSTGSVGIGFIDVGNFSIASVDYTISGNGITPLQGRISLTDQSSTPSANVGGILPGSQYLLELRATPSDDNVQCYGAASFDVMAGQAASVTITLVCGNSSMFRTITVNGMTDYCPWISSYAASPSTGVVGGPPISLTAVTGSHYSDPPMVTWTATAGSLASPTASVCAYSCTVPGRQTVTVTVTDGNCPDTASLFVSCLPAASVDASADSRGHDGGML